MRHDRRWRDPLKFTNEKRKQQNYTSRGVIVFVNLHKLDGSWS